MKIKSIEAYEVIDSRSNPTVECKLILEKLLESSGLEEGVHYDRQTTIRDNSGKPIFHDETGKRLIPDVIIHYPDGKDCIIDSKVSLSDYLDYCNAETDDTREQALKRHITSIRKHVKELKDAMVVVTIITDGMENASKEYSGSAVKSLVDELRHEGWTFTYMGANQDAVEVAVSLSIRNARNFDYSSKGAKKAMAKDCSTRMSFFRRIHDFRTENMDVDAKLSAAERNDLYASMANEAFDEEENN